MFIHMIDIFNKSVLIHMIDIILKNQLIMSHNDI